MSHNLLSTTGETHASSPTHSLATALLLPGPAPAAETRLDFGGGPAGGTFQYFSNGIATRLTQLLPEVEVSQMASAGSVENIRRIQSGQIDFGIAYSGDTYLARNGGLTNDDNTYQDVRALAFLYGAPAHLVVLADSGITQVADLAGKRIAVGGAGSGAAAAAERYFNALELWDTMKIEFIGYSKAADALDDGLIDAMWIFAGFPNTSVIQAAAHQKIRLLNTWNAGSQAGVFQSFPFYTAVTIPAGTYSGVDYDVKSFQDSALWIASKKVAPDLVYRALDVIFNEEGLSYMTKVKSTARAMSISGALHGIVTPLHEGAIRFWSEHGLPLTKAQRGG
ncbi:MAG: TAXI family TRAP transporter solute-binding subunit [Desulfuromonadales bacterium]